MSWTCGSCGTRHETDEQRESCRRQKRHVTAIAVAAMLFIFAIIFAIVLGVSAAWASFAYGDWTCAFIECRKIISLGQP
jgi:hypothetical protein